MTRCGNSQQVSGCAHYCTHLCVPRLDVHDGLVRTVPQCRPPVGRARGWLAAAWRPCNQDAVLVSLWLSVTTCLPCPRLARCPCIHDTGSLKICCGSWGMG